MQQTNVEIKARCRDPHRQRELARGLGTTVETQAQVDTFFAVSGGRLKLRELGPDRGKLIFYARPDVSGPKSSTYSISTTNEPEALREILAAALGIRGEVRKHRSLFHADQTRVHVDEVEQLGTFLEIEVVLRPGQTHEDGVAIARTFMRRLEIRDDDLIDCAYVDLLIDSKSQGAV